MDREEEARLKFGQRIQRCYGCFVAFYMKDMWLAEGGLFYCNNCKDDSMFHFEDFSRKLDLSKLQGERSDEEDRH